jgi:hypothetical protein
MSFTAGSERQGESLRANTGRAHLREGGPYTHMLCHHLAAGFADG